MYTPKHLRLWTRPDCYVGETWPNYYSAGFGQSRDSDVLERSNFEAVRRALSEVEPEGDKWQIVRERHWAVGWVDWIAIGDDCECDELLRVADAAKAKVADYPILDEELYSEMENEECESIWQNCYNEGERLDYLREHVCREYLTFREVREAVRGEWYYAAQLLPCPSDIIG